MPVDHPQWGTFCDLCFHKLNKEDYVGDTDGQKWSVCKGVCAQQAGIKEKLDNEAT